MSVPDCTVIIPSRNRASCLERALEALARQTVPSETFEVIVVLDGSRDDSTSVLARWSARGPMRVRWAWQRQQGQAAARNAGAEMAAAPLLAFLDDDVVPAVGWLSAHCRRHARGDRVVVVGDAPIPRRPRPSWYDLVVWAWWTDEYDRRTHSGATRGYRDLCAGNFSVRRSDFWRAGGFDPTFRGYGAEDYDLGVRLLDIGLRIVVDPQALAHHEHATKPLAVLRNMRDEGRQDVLLGRKHPMLRGGLRLAQPTTWGTRLLFLLPDVVDVAIGAVRGFLPVYERLGLRSHWLRLFGRLRHVAYWQGVRDALGGWRALREYVAATPAPPRVPLELGAGLPRTLSRMPLGSIDAEATLCGRFIGAVRLNAGPIGMTGRELADAVVDQLYPRLLLGLAESGQGLPW